MKKRAPVISLIGRPNVGKSTIFNKLLKKGNRAITYDKPGVTRDRHYSILTVDDEVNDDKYDVILVDTGGFYPEKIQEEDKKNSFDPFFNLMADHAKLAITESDLVLFVVDVREGLIPHDKVIADYIRTSGKPFWLIVNKYDSDKQAGEEVDFYQLGLNSDQLMTMSAEHGRGLIYLKEKILNFSKKFNKELDERMLQKGIVPNYDVVASLALIGAPNVGKSTLLNRMLGSERALVSNVAGTTVDPIEGYFDLYFGASAKNLNTQDNQFRQADDTILKEFLEISDSQNDPEEINWKEIDLSEAPSDFQDEEDFDESEDFEYKSFDEGDEEGDLYSVEEIAEKFEDKTDEVLEIEEEDEASFLRSLKLVDTAGIRKSKLVEGFIETQSVYRSLRAISEADVVIYMVDATKGFAHQDRRLCDIALEKGKSIILCLNKIDLMKETFNDHKKRREWLLDLKAEIPWLGFCELITISALKGSHITALKNAIKKTVMVRSAKIGTSQLNKVITSLISKNPVVVEKSRGARFKLKYASMIKSDPPTILMFTNKSKGIPDHYRKYLVNGIRNEFKLSNTPVHLIFRTTTDLERRLKKVMPNI